MLNKKLALSLVSIFILISHAHADTNTIKFHDSENVTYTTSSFAEAWNKKLNTKGEKYNFIIVRSPDGKNKSYREQNDIINKLESNFESRKIIWIDGCVSDCHPSTGYKLVYENETEKPSGFEIWTINSKSIKVRKSKNILDRKWLLKHFGLVD